MRIEENYSLEKHNTFRLQVNTRWFVEYDKEEDLKNILKDEYFQEMNSIHIGSGSNLLFINDFNGAVIHSAIKGIEHSKEAQDEVILRIGAAELWDDVVAYAVSKGLGGIENLSHIPGEAGAAAIQNIGAYGVEIADVIESVEAYHRFDIEKRIFSKDQCEYGYRKSWFKNENNDPHIITHISIRLSKKPEYKLDYGNLRNALANKADISLSDIRNAVIAIRSEKLPDPDKLGNAGSFFMNPVIAKEEYNSLKAKYPDMPAYPAEGGKVKLAAGWLIEQCGMKGKSHGTVGIYEKQALVIVNLGGAIGDEIALLAESVRIAVMDKFGVELIPEVKYIG
jgi:UDP-N-acetylenolpyruvoylglucosamine reductase